MSRWKHWANKIRYDALVSSILARTLRPVQRTAEWVQRELSKKIWINGARVEYDGIALSFPRNVGVGFASAIFWHGVDGFEPHTWRVLRHYISLSAHFIDVGSNIGLYSVLAKKVHPGVLVDAFEPVPSICEKNRRFHTANGEDATRVWQVALCDTDGEGLMHLPLPSGSVEEETTGTLRKDSWQARSAARMDLRVATARLDTFLDSHDKRGPMTIKIDVEDAESLVLLGAASTLAALRPVIVSEILPRAHRNAGTLELLRGAGYTPFGITGEGLFRFQWADFGHPRGIVDFLLLPAGFGIAEQCYIPLTALPPFPSQSR